MKVPNFTRHGCDGREACALDARKFWQSRMTIDGRVPPVPELTDLEELARSLTPRPS